MAEPTQQQIEIARALAKADGLAPESVITMLPEDMPRVLPDGRKIYREGRVITGEAWTFYIDRVRQFEQALDDCFLTIRSIF